MPIKSFQQFTAEDAPATTGEQVATIRNLLAALISSGAMDALIKRDLLMKEEIHTYSAKHDEERYRTRLRALRHGLAALLTRDAQLDDDLLRKHGITKWDRTEAADPSTTAAKDAVVTAKRQELVAKRGVLNAKQAELADQQRRVQRDIAKNGGVR